MERRATFHLGNRPNSYAKGGSMANATPDHNSSANFPVTKSPVYDEGDALDKLTTEVVVAVRNDCDFDEQCSMTTPQTECRDGKCMCQGNMHPYVKDNITQCFVRGEKKIGDKCEESLDCGYDGGVCDKTKKPICQCSPELPVTNHIDKCGKGKEEKGNRPITPQSNSARRGGYLKRASTHARGAGDERLKLEMIYFDIFSGVTIQVELNVGHQQRSNRTMTASAWLRHNMMKVQQQIADTQFSDILGLSQGISPGHEEKNY
uniref:EB domain-containing protein n=1 Tax=Timema shepardi TaxID=629360 RepID=A0A7R9FUY0_TIMSH|nr:unnamed protein product [Timema shepardi]